MNDISSTSVILKPIHIHASDKGNTSPKDREMTEVQRAIDVQRYFRHGFLIAFSSLHQHLFSFFSSFFFNMFLNAIAKGRLKFDFFFLKFFGHHFCYFFLNSVCWIYKTFHVIIYCDFYIKTCAERRRRKSERSSGGGRGKRKIGRG